MGEKSQIKTCESLNFLQKKKKKSVVNCALEADPLHIYCLQHFCLSHISNWTSYPTLS